MNNKLYLDWAPERYGIPLLAHSDRRRCNESDAALTAGTLRTTSLSTDSPVLGGASALLSRRLDGDLRMV